MRKEKEQAELEKERAEKKTQRAERSEHNTEYKATPSTPDNRAKPKKQEQVLHVLIIILNIILITKMSKHPIIDQRLNQKPDLHLIEIKTYHHSLQEITQNLHTNQKGKQEDQQIHKQRQKFKKIYSKKNQKHKQNQTQEKTPNTTLK